MNRTGIGMATAGAAVVWVVLGAGVATGQVYRWDTGEVISDTVPGPGANFTSETLSYADLVELDLAGASFDLADLAFARLTRSNLSHAGFGSANLEGADFTDANVRGASFTRYASVTTLSADQLYSTASYKDKNLAGINLSGNNLTGWSFIGQNLTSAYLGFTERRPATVLTSVDFSDAIVRETNFVRTTLSGFTAAQLYSTGSYHAHDLRGINLQANDLTGWDFAGQNLTSANFDAPPGGRGGGRNSSGGFPDTSYLTDAILRFADTRSANLKDSQITSAADTRNLIRPDGRILGFDLHPGETMRLWDYEGDIPITIEESFAIDPVGVLRAVFEDEVWGSTIRFQPGLDVPLAGTLELMLDDSALKNLALIGATYQVFDWTGVVPTGAFNLSVPQAGVAFDASALHETGQVTLTALPYVLGDLNGDGVFDAFDVAPFEAALADPAAFLAANPGWLPDVVGDFNGDGVLDAFDVAALENQLANGASVPEPGTLGLVVLAGLGMRRRR